ncbi:serine hydrolase domain-containing protein [Winogradskya humida]|uniref:Beta-lactamase-related domain-containing protein n=1 Tax=Winogradskya humida TaxID=113566 RepID=A0ABQ3ZYW4_9ACTN|nr:serine hydrolase [Actinoplanes humidus]GIE23776.1 hypothetical protein Ahu01nite_068780 [Actinoplanes humidus]
MQSTVLPRSTPGEQGVDAGGIERFVAAVAGMDGVELHSLMVLRHGHVVDERWWHPYAPGIPHGLYSLSKSFTSTALGMAVAEGLVDLDATVLSYFPELDEVVTDAGARSIRVRHVAAMASGHEEETVERARVAGGGDLLRGFLQVPPEREPGTVFAYNQPCTYALSAIISRVSGGSLTGFLRPRLFEPLGISTYGWEADRVGRQLGFAGLHVATEAIAKVGQLYLDGGVWAGRRLLSAEWVAEATRKHVETGRPEADWNLGYGFQFWRSRHGYRGDGAYGQYMLVLPEQDAVIAMTAQSPDMAAQLDAVWTHLLPALTAGKDKAQTAGADNAHTAGADNAHTAGGDNAHTAGGDNAHTAGATSAQTAPVTELAQPGRGDSAQTGTATELELERPVGPARLTTGSYRAGAGNEVPTVREVVVDTKEIVVDGEAMALGDDGGWAGGGAVVTAYGADVVDLVFVETPHRMTIVLDAGAGTFAARWRTVPLGRPTVAAQRMPR